MPNNTTTEQAALVRKAVRQQQQQQIVLTDKALRLIEQVEQRRVTKPLRAKRQAPGPHKQGCRVHSITDIRGSYQHPNRIP